MHAAYSRDQASQDESFLFSLHKQGEPVGCAYMREEEEEEGT